MHRALFCMALLAGACAEAATFHVDDPVDSNDVSPGDGVCADAQGRCSLRAAVQETNALAGGDAIVLAAGTYALTIAGSNEDASASGDLDVSDDLLLQGAGADDTIIDAGALDRVFDLRPAAAKRTIRFEALTLRNGRLSEGSETITDPKGAALRIGVGVDVTLDHVDIRDNRLTTFAGAAGIDNYGCLHGRFVRIVGNTDSTEVGSGHAMAGGIVTSGADSCLVLDDSEITDNRGDQSGAIYVTDVAPVTLRHSLVARNEARFSGAIQIDRGEVVLLENVTVSGNTGDPGAILNDGFTQLVLHNSTVTGNHGFNVGGIQDVHGGFGMTWLSNTILSGNGHGFIADDCDRGISEGGGNLIGDSTRCHFDTQPSDLFDLDPGLGPLADNGGFTLTHLPGPNAIDHGAAEACLADDQRGIARPQDGDEDGNAVCDIGAVEFVVDAIFRDGFEAG